MSCSQFKCSLTKIICLAAVFFAFATTSFMSVSRCYAQSSPGGFSGTVPGMAGPGAAQDDTPGGNTVTKQAGANGDFTPDEKRIRKKYNAALANAQGVINRATNVMAKNPPGSKEYKHAQISKEVGEKSLAELKANDPYPDSRDKKKR